MKGPSVGLRLVLSFQDKARNAATTELFTKGLAFTSSGPETDKIQQNVRGVLLEVQQAEADVTEMSKRLDEGILKLRRDSLKDPLNEIESFFSRVQDCFQQAIDDKKKIQDQEQLKVSMTKLQARLEETLKLAVAHVPGILSLVNDFLQDKGFLTAAAGLAWEKSDEFLSYYMKTKALFLLYWVKFAKGITLLELAQHTPNVGFEKGSQAVTQLIEKVEAQDKAFFQAVGNDTSELAEVMLGQPTEQTPVIWLSGWGSSIELVLRDVNSLVHHNVPRARDGAPHQKYLLEVTTTVSAQNFDLSKSYPIRIWDAAGSEFVGRTDNPLPISMGHDDGGWYIKPITVASDHFRFKGSDGRYNNETLVTGWNENRLEHRPNVDVKIGLDGTVDRAYYGLKPWT